MERALLRGSLRLGRRGTVRAVSPGGSFCNGLLLLLLIAAELDLRVALRDLRVDLLLQLLACVGEVLALQLLHLASLTNAAVREDHGEVAQDLRSIKLVRAERRRARL